MQRCEIANTNACGRTGNSLTRDSTIVFFVVVFTYMRDEAAATRPWPYSCITEHAEHTQTVSDTHVCGKGKVFATDRNKFETL